VRPPAQLGWLDIDADEFSADRRGHLARLYRRYRQANQADEKAK
jgi:hypothetical protein